MAAFTWIVAILSIIGVVLNVRQDRRCFYLWTGTNAAWAVVDFSQGLYAQAALFAVYFGLAVWGLYAWKRKGTA